MAERRDRRFDGLRTSALLLRGHLSRYRQPGLQDVATASLRSGPGRRPWALALVNTTLRLRRAGTYLLVLRPRSELSRLRFRSETRLHPITAEHRSIALLCPTRSRVSLARTFARSVARTAEHPGRVGVLFYVDDDDPELGAYRELIGTARGIGRCELITGPPIGVPGAWNALACAAGTDLLAMANDDQLYVDHGWDVRLDQAMDQFGTTHPDEICCLYFEAGQYPDGTADFPILSRAWYLALGYFTPEIFAQWEVETWVFDLARRVQRLVPVPGVLVEHRHYQDYKAPFDATYQRHRMTREKSFADHGLFLRTTQLRDDDADRLRRVISPRPAVVPGDDERPWYLDHLTRRLPAMRVEAAAGTGPGEPGVPGPTPQRTVLFCDGGRQPGADGTALIAAVLAEIPEATTRSPGSAVLHRLPPGEGVQEASRNGGSRVLVAILADDPVMVGASGMLLPEGGFVLLPDGGGYELRNRSATPAAVLVLDVPHLDT